MWAKSVSIIGRDFELHADGDKRDYDIISIYCVSMWVTHRKTND